MARERRPRGAAGLACLALAACGGAEAPRDPAGGTRARSLVLFVVDTLRADALGVYGAPEGVTPHVDAFAAGARVYRSAYAQATHTNAAMAAIWTGLLPHHNGVLGQSDDLAPGVDSVAPLLRARGFATGAFVSGHCALQRKRLWSEGFDAVLCRRDESPLQSEWDAYVVERALEWIEAQEGPFVAWVMLLDPHDERQPPRDLWDYAADPPLPPAEQRRAYARFEAEGGPPAHELERMRALYRAEVRGADRAFGRLYGALADRDDLAWIFTADHGEELFESSPRAYHGRVLTEGVLRVPLIVRAPGIEPGAFDGLVETLQVAPTMLELLDAPLPRALDGPSLLAPDAARAGAFSCWGDVVTLRRGDLRAWMRAPGLAPDPMAHLYAEADARSPVPWLAQEASAVRYAEGGAPAAIAADDAAAARGALLARVAGLRPVRGGDGTLSEELERELEALGYLGR